MRHAIWKLAALASVVGVGLLVVIQAQHSMNKSGSGNPAATQESAPDDASAETELNSGVPASRQSEPSLGPEDFSDVEPVPAALKTGTRMTASRSGPRTPDKSLTADPFDNEDSSANGLPARNGPRTAGASPTSVNIVDLDDPDDPFNKPAPGSKKSTEKPRPGSVVLTLNGDEADLDAGPKLIPDEPLETDGAAGPRLLATNDETPRSKTAKSEAADPFGDDEAPTARPAPKTTSAKAAPKRPMDDDPFGDETEKKPSKSAPLKVTPRTTLADDLGLSDDLLPVQRPKERATATPGTTRSNAVTADPFGDDEPARLPAARVRSAPAITDQEPVAKTADDQDAFPRTNSAISEKKESAPASETDPRRGNDRIGIPTLRGDDEDEPAPSRQPARDTASGITRPSPSSADPFGDDEKIETKPSPTRPAPSVTDEEPAPKSKDEGDAFPKGTGRPTLDPDADAEPLIPAPRNSPKPSATPVEDDSESIGRSAPAATPGRAAPQRVQSPQVAIDKVAPQTAHLNREMIYDILVRNVGATPAHQVTVEDTVPKGVKLVGSIPQAMIDGNRLIWKLGTLEPGRDKKISVKVIPQSEGVIGTVATVNFAAEVGSRTTIASPKLKLELDAPRQVTIGAPVVLNFRISNIGRADASGVVLREVLPAALRHPEGDDLEYEIGALPAGRSREVKLTLTAAQAGRAVNRAVVTADGNLSEESELQFEVLGPNLGVSRTGPKKLFLNKVGSFTNTVTNPGSTAATNLMLVETVPAGLEFVSATEDGQFNAAKRQVSWNISRLEPGESRKVQVTLSANGRGSQVSVVRAYDGGGASGEAVATTNVTGIASLAIEISEIPSIVEVGEGITLQVRVRNRGTDVATNVRASVVVPAGIEVVSVTGQGKPKPSNVATPAGAAVSRATRNQREIQFDPIARLDSREEATIDVTLQARAAGNGRLQLSVQSDQTGEPIRREELLHVVTAQE